MIRWIAKNRGLESQIKKLREELMELFEALHEGDTKHILEEMADVIITILQVMFLLGISKLSLIRVIFYKLFRTITRIKKGYYDA